MKKLLIIILLTQILFSATSEQVERYLNVSNVEEELIELESQFAGMQKKFQTSDTNVSQEEETYDMQMLSIRFKEYLQKNLSENEMEEILQVYKNVVFLQFVSASSVTDTAPEEVEAYVKTFENNESSGVRLSLVEKIQKEFNSKESMTLMFDELIKPLMQITQSGLKMDDGYVKKSREEYLKSMTEKAKRETLFIAKDFTIEELEELLKVAQSPAIGYETKALYGGMAFALKEFFLMLLSRYDLSKNQK